MFLAIMVETRQISEPILIGAPVGLLKNWEEEHQKHLEGDGTFETIRQWFERIQKCKRQRHR